MAKSFAQNMKSAIVNDLQNLVNGGTLGAVIADDMTKLNPLYRDWPKYPAGLVIPPVVSASEYYDTATNLREYTWYVMIVTTPDNLPRTDPTYLEGLVDAVLNEFDSDVTLQGMSIGGVSAAVTEAPGPVNSGNNTFVVFYVTLKARTLVSAGVQIS